MKRHSFIFTLTIIAFLSSCLTLPNIDKFFVASEEIGHRDLNVTFLGTSSFLIQTSKANVLIDGYFTRTRLNLFRGVEPDAERVSKVLCGLGIALKDLSFLSDETNRERCLANHTQLDVVIPMHGHFDHALDAPLIAALTGADLVGDNSTCQIYRATKDKFPVELSYWEDVSFSDVSVTAKDASYVGCIDGSITRGHATQELSYGDVTVTLFETPHSTNFFSRILEGDGQIEEIKFRTSIDSMKQGVSLSAHVKVYDRAFLIIPTAGQLNSRIETLGLNAEVVFLGVGGLSLQNEVEVDAILRNIIGDGKVDLVYPIHWDDFKKPLSLACPKLSAPIYESLQKIEQHLLGFSKPSQPLEVVFPPVARSFDPFQIRVEDMSFGTTC